MEFKKIRSLIYEVTNELVNREIIFDVKSRKRYLQYFVNPIEAHVGVSPDREINQSELRKSDQTCSRFPLDKNMPVSWIKNLKAEQKIENIMVSSVKCVASRDLKMYDAIVALRGELIDCTSGYELYKCYGDSYNGLTIFNLGKAFDFMWFCTKKYIAEPQSMLMLTSTNPNSELAVVNFNNCLYPIVYAIKPIEMGQYIFLSNSCIQEWNLEFCEWKQNAGINHTNK